MMYAIHSLSHIFNTRAHTHTHTTHTHARTHAHTHTHTHTNTSIKKPTQINTRTHAQTCLLSNTFNLEIRFPENGRFGSS